MVKLVSRDHTFRRQNFLNIQLYTSWDADSMPCRVELLTVTSHTHSVLCLSLWLLPSPYRMHMAFISIRIKRELIFQGFHISLFARIRAMPNGLWFWHPITTSKNLLVKRTEFCPAHTHAACNRKKISLNWKFYLMSKTFLIHNSILYTLRMVWTKTCVSHISKLYTTNRLQFVYTLGCINMLSLHLSFLCLIQKIMLNMYVRVSSRQRKK